MRWIIKTLCLAIPLLMPLAARSAGVPIMACADASAGQNMAQTGRAAYPDIPARQLADIALYADIHRHGATFAPAGWICQVNLFPNIYDIAIVPNAAILLGLGNPPLWAQPMVEQQFLSEQGALPERIGFYALATALFPTQFPGGAARWVAAPLAARGHPLDAAGLRALDPVGAQDIIIHRSPRLVEFITPAGAQGLGTTGAAGNFTGAPFSVHGVVEINAPTDGSPATMEIFAFRLGPVFDSNTPTLLHLAEAQLNHDFAADAIR